MRRTVVVGLVAMAVVAAGCGDDDAGPPLLVLPSTVGTAVVDGDTGAIEQLAAGAASSPDGGVLFGTEPDGAAATSVRARRTATAGTLWRASVAGAHEARVADADGDRVVLGPSRAGVGLVPGTLAPGRSTTPLVVVGSDGTVVEHTVPGNVEPEAFSVDGDSLFVVNYVPPEAPTYYQVRQLDLATGELAEVFSVDAELQRTMRGTARTQTWDPGGDRLYTLYTLEDGGAFVHVLDLAAEWAHCVDLPAGIGATSAGMALSDDGRTLYVADAAGGGIAEVDTEALAVTEEGSLPGGAADPTVVAIDGRRLLIGHGFGIDVVDRGTFERLDRFETDEAMVGLQVEGDELFVARPSSIVVLDARSGEERRRLPLDLGGGSVLSLGPTSIPTYAGIQCAC